MSEKPNSSGASPLLWAAEVERVAEALRRRHNEPLGDEYYFESLARAALAALSSDREQVSGEAEVEGDVDVLREAIADALVQATNDPSADEDRFLTALRAAGFDVVRR